MLETAMGQLLDMIADRVVDRLSSTSHRMVAQHGSPLGPRNHRAAVKRRMERGEGGATIIGRRYLLTHEALASELSLPVPARKLAKPARPDLDKIKQDALAAMRAARKAC